MAYSKAGCENPTPGSRMVEITVPHKTSMATAAMAGSFSRKIPGPKKAGQDVAGEANQVKITHGASPVGKQTWKGSREGFTIRKAPKFTPAISTPEHSGGARQSVKGKRGSKAPAEAAQVSGRKQ